MSMSKNYFVTFGCWNNGGCEKDTDLSKVMTKLKSLNPPPEKIFVAGDNYYPEKEKTKSKNNALEKKKIFNLETLVSGFKCLPKNVPIYINYGNHDYENGLTIRTEDGEQVDKSCILTKTEKKLVEKISLEGHRINLKMFQSIHFGGSTLVIMIDTTMYDNEDNTEYKDCYKDALIDTVDTTYAFEEAKTAQKTFMSSVVTDIINTPSISNIVIIGHHPIINYKIKKGSVITLSLDELATFLYESLFKNLKELQRKFSYYYLCADLHQYQSGTITIGEGDQVMNIRQYIAGTGGASKDTYDGELIPRERYVKKVELNGINYTYQMSSDDITNSRSENGFLRCEENADETLHFQFYTVNNEVIECNPSLTGGYKKHKHTKRSKKKTHKKTYRKKISKSSRKLYR